MLKTNDPQVLTAVDFLDEVYQKGHTDSELRQYLFHRRRLNITQIDRAFEIHAAHVRARKRTKMEGDRPEVTKTTSTLPQTADLAILLPANREKGKELIKHFLMTEFNYNNVLNCLNEEYYKHLCDLSDRGKIKIQRKELEPMFHRIPQLVKFHKAFYQEMVHRKANFGQFFVRQFNGFREYLEYVKDCNFSTKKMREYLFDKELRKALEQARIVSRRPNDDIMDLLLSPLDRIRTYKEFVDNMRNWADKTQASEFEFLEKASRRIGRIVDLVGMYKHTIINRNEMNKVQQFLDKQCTIITPNRRIVRRGLMTRRTTTWPVRNKHYVFFLFNDVLLWTTKKGELQNLVFLRDCEVKQSESKNSPERKFEVIANCTQHYKYHKHLKLECKEPRQRDQWFKAIKREVAQSKLVKTAKVNSKTSPMEQELVKYIEKQAENQPDYLKPPPDTGNTVESKSKEASEASIDHEFEEEISNPRHRRYQHSMNFEAKDLNENFLPMEDMSLASESEQEPSVVDHHEYGNSMGVLFPNVTGQKEKSKEISQESINRIQGHDGRTEIFSRGSYSVDPNERDSRHNWRSQQRPNSDSMSTSSKDRIERPKKTSIIRRGESSVANLRRLSSCTICLDNF